MTRVKAKASGTCGISYALRDKKKKRTKTIDVLLEKSWDRCEKTALKRIAGWPRSHKLQAVLGSTSTKKKQELYDAREEW